MEKENPDLIRPGLWAHPKHINEIKKKLRAKVPKITLYDIRLERQAFHEAILTDLYEAGLIQSAQFIQSLIDMDEEFKAKQKSQEAYLKTNAGKRCLQTIAERLKVSEIKFHEGHKNESVEDVLELAQILSGHANQLWIVEQIYIACVKATKVYRLDGGLLEARVRFYYGRFLMDKYLNVWYKKLTPEHFTGGLYDAAYDTLKISHDMSIARDWSIKLESGMEKDLGKEVSYLLFLCLSKRAESQPPILAQEYSKRALKFALASENKYIIPRAYLERGDREMDARNFEDAGNFYSKAITFAQVSNQSDFICQGYLKKGYALQKSNQISRATTFAKLAKRAADDSGSSYYLAKSYMLYGEIAVSRSIMNVAAYNFMTAAEIFNELDKFKLSREARFLGAFAMSHIVLEQLVDLIRKSDRTHNLNKLIQWKEHRVPFWNVEDESGILKRVSDVSELDRRKSILAAFGYYESFSHIDNREYVLPKSEGSNKHNYSLWREWRSTF